MEGIVKFPQYFQTSHDVPEIYTITAPGGGYTNHEIKLWAGERPSGPGYDPAGVAGDLGHIKQVGGIIMSAVGGDVTIRFHESTSPAYVISSGSNADFFRDCKVDKLYITMAVGVTLACGLKGW